MKQQLFLGVASLVILFFNGCDPKTSGSWEINDDNATTFIQDLVTIDVLANDSYTPQANEHNTVLHVESITVAPQYGTVVIETDDTITYTPDGTYLGYDTFSYRVYVSGIRELNSGGFADFNKTGEEANVTVNILDAPNTPPLSHDQTVELNCSVAAAPSVDIVLYGSDSDGDPLSYVIVAQPLWGTLSPLSGNMTTYTLLGSSFSYICDGENIDQFTYKVNDTKEDSNVSTITIQPIY